MTDLILQLKDYLNTAYADNPFVNLLEMNIVDLEAGSSTLSMPVIKDKHTNLYKIAHGGALASLADTAMGIACATTGKKVVTVNMNLNYIRGAECQTELTATARIIHDGSRTMVAEAEILDNDNNLIVKSSATFFVTGTFL